MADPLSAILETTQAEQLPLLAGYAAASIQGLVASGPRAGHPVRRLRSAAAVVDQGKPRCARLEGFSRMLRCPPTRASG